MCCCSRTTIKQFNFYGQNMMSNKRPHIYTSATDVPTTVNIQHTQSHHQPELELHSVLYFYTYMREIRTKMLDDESIHIHETV